MEGDKEAEEVKGVSEVGDSANIGIDSETIINSIGPNNKYLERIRYTFSQVDTTHIVL